MAYNFNSVLENPVPSITDGTRDLAYAAWVCVQYTYLLSHPFVGFMSPIISRINHIGWIVKIVFPIFHGPPDTNI